MQLVHQKLTDKLFEFDGFVARTANEFEYCRILERFHVPTHFTIWSRKTKGGLRGLFASKWNFTTIQADPELTSINLVIMPKIITRFAFAILGLS